MSAADRSVMTPTKTVLWSVDTDFAHYEAQRLKAPREEATPRYRAGPGGVPVFA